jgi:predicted dehydrogenase
VRYGRPVLIEKPPGRDILETRRVADLLDGHPHMVSLNRRFDPAVAIARQWLARQTRPPRFVHGLVMRRDRREPDFSWSTGVHMADLLCFLAGPLEFARGRRTPFKRVGYLVGEHPMYAAIELWPAAHRVAETVHMGGDGWWARIETGTHQPWRVVCHRDRADEIDAAADPATPAFVRNGTADETATFLRGLLDRRWTGPTLGDAVAGTCIAQSLQDLNEANEAPL